MRAVIKSKWCGSVSELSLNSPPNPWLLVPQSGFENERLVDDTEAVCTANQRRMKADPLEVMLLNMGYRITSLTGSELGSDDDTVSEREVHCRTT